MTTAADFPPLQIGPLTVPMPASISEAARKYLAATGIDGSRLESKGFGESQPAADNGTADGRAENRRTEIEVTD